MLGSPANTCCASFQVTFHVALQMLSYLLRTIAYQDLHEELHGTDTLKYPKTHLTLPGRESFHGVEPPVH